MSEIIRVAEKLYKEINPESKMGDPPSMVYEAIEAHHRTYQEDLTPRHRRATSFEDFVRTLTHKGEYSKEQALLMISWGYKMTHRSFDSNEWLSRTPKSKVHFLDEDNNVINMKKFWRYRIKPVWDSGWSVYKEKKKRGR